MTEEGLYDKYTVLKDGEEITDCFVLRPESDPTAREALETYARETDNGELAHDIWVWLDGITGGPKQGPVVDPDDYPESIRCEECGGRVTKLGANHGGYQCRECFTTYPFEAAEERDGGEE